MLQAVQRLLAQRASNTATAFAISRTLGFDVNPNAVNWVLSHTDQRPSNAYDVAYLIASSRRITKAMSSGNSLATAAAPEVQYNKQHKEANAVRNDAIKQTKSQGTIVGWYAHYDSKTSPACRLANGNNFDAMEGTVIGYPGSVHPHCRCFAGPAHPNGQWVDDVLQANPVGV
jgi:SPP1 gp7 family putative phage head morphogenesis protein